MNIRNLKWKLLSPVPLFTTPWTIQSMEFSRTEYWSALPSQQRLNPGLPHCRQIYQLNHKGSPRIPEWVAYPFSSRSSRPRNWTGVSCIAGKFFTEWAIKEALIYLKFIKENSTTLYVLFLKYTFFFSLQVYNIVFLKMKIAVKLF